mgnify:CR=1 FL=1
MRKMMKKWGMSEDIDDENYQDVAPTQPLSDIMNVNGSIRAVDCTIHFYSDVNTLACSELNR